MPSNFVISFTWGIFFPFDAVDCGELGEEEKIIAEILVSVHPAKLSVWLKSCLVFK